MTTRAGRHMDARAARLLTCGVLAGPLFTFAWLVEGATRADYDPLRHPISSLALGELGWTQTLNFLVTGGLMLAFAVGLWRAQPPDRRTRWGTLLIGAYAVGLIGAGAFVTDPVSGYPPGSPDRLAGYSTEGVLHDLFSTLVFLGLPAACFVFARHFGRLGERRWARWSAVTGAVFAVGTVLASLAFGQADGLVAWGGLLQRITLTIGWTWLTLLAIDLRRRAA